MNKQAKKAEWKAQRDEVRTMDPVDLETYIREYFAESSLVYIRKNNQLTPADIAFIIEEIADYVDWSERDVTKLCMIQETELLYNRKV